MNKAEFDKIREALEMYLEAHKMSQNEFSKLSNVNVRYVSDMRKDMEVPSKWVKIIAETIGYSLKKEYWAVKQTEQLMRIIPTLEDAKNFGYTRIIIGETGCGKTFCTDLFAKQHPTDLFSIKVGSSDNLGDLLDKLIEKIGISTGRTKSKKIRDIIKYLSKLKREGAKPMIIFDECEYMKVATICAIKELYDALVNVCAIVLVGTQQFVDNLQKLVTRDKTGMRQFYRRVKFGIVELPDVDRTFKMFLDDVPTDVKRFARENCDNYGELHDLIVPTLREAERLEQTMSVMLIKQTFGMQTFL